MVNNQENAVTVIVHRPDLQEKLFFLLSGIITSVPLTLFVGTFTDSLCISLPMFYSQICSVAFFTPFIEEFSKAFPLFYRHCETTRSLFTLGFVVGLGFGFTEFLLYVFALGQPIFVRLPAIFFHAATTSITAYGLILNILNTDFLKVDLNLKKPYYLRIHSKRLRNFKFG
ncbi:MAG: PrsW family glutamic-type intramembrane protease [Candidatus Bathyarchaeota archaeon]